MCENVGFVHWLIESLGILFHDWVETHLVSFLLGGLKTILLVLGMKQHTHFEDTIIFTSCWGLVNRLQ